MPGRRVGDNIMALQLLPYLLRRAGRWALAVFCDFFKAYDTIDREFLFSALSALGVGDAFISLVRPLLTDTCARAVVNGFISGLASFLARVRQGCPLAPLLYLFIAQALHSFLHARGIGIPDLLPGSLRTTTTGTYADDAQVLLETPAQITAFLSAMDTFAAATGQRLNPAKSRLLALGAVPPDLEAALPPPVARRGVPLVEVATALGVPFSNGEPPAGVLAAGEEVWNANVLSAWLVLSPPLPASPLWACRCLGVALPALAMVCPACCTVRSSWGTPQVLLLAASVPSPPAWLIAPAPLLPLAVPSLACTTLPCLAGLLMVALVCCLGSPTSRHAMRFGLCA